MGGISFIFLLLFYCFFINPRMCCMGRLDKTSNRRGLMGVLYWATKEDGKHEGKGGVNSWYRGDKLRKEEIELSENEG